MSSSVTESQTAKLYSLSNDEFVRFQQFKTTLSQKELWREEFKDEKASHDDATLLRFLREHKFNVQKSVAQFAATEKWLSSLQIQELYSAIDVDIFEMGRRMYGLWTGRRDKGGHPLYILQVSRLRTKDIQEYYLATEQMKENLPAHKNMSTPAKSLALYAVMHNILNFVFPLCSSIPRSDTSISITKSTNIIDISGVGLSQWWALKSHIQAAGVLTTDYYPDILDKTFVVGAPAFFSIVFGWVKRWFGEGVVGRIAIVGEKEMEDVLRAAVDVKDLPVQYGGDLQWEYGSVMMDEDVKMAVESDGREGWIEGPCYWENGKRRVVGTVGGVKRVDTDERL